MFLSYYWIDGRFLSVFYTTERDSAHACHRLSIYGLSDPERPDEVCSTDRIRSEPKQILIRGDYAYTAEGPDGIGIYRLDGFHGIRQ